MWHLNNASHANHLSCCIYGIHIVHNIRIEFQEEVPSGRVNRKQIITEHQIAQRIMWENVGWDERAELSIEIMMNRRVCPHNVEHRVDEVEIEWGSEKNMQCTGILSLVSPRTLELFKEEPLVINERLDLAAQAIACADEASKRAST